MKRNLNNDLKEETSENKLNPQIYINKDGKLSCEIRVENKKIKTNLRLHSRDVTYIRYILDSQFIPVSAKIIKKKEGFRIRIFIHNQ